MSERTLEELRKSALVELVVGETPCRCGCGKKAPYPAAKISEAIDLQAKLVALGLGMEELLDTANEVARSAGIPLKEAECLMFEVGEAWRKYKQAQGLPVADHAITHESPEFSGPATTHPSLKAMAREEAKQLGPRVMSLHLHRNGKQFSATTESVGGVGPGDAAGYMLEIIAAAIHTARGYAKACDASAELTERAIAEAVRIGSDDREGSTQVYTADPKVN